MAGRLPRSPFLNNRFSAAVKEFGIELMKTGSINHPGNRGGAREEVLRTFFRQRLPMRYAVAEGEVIDLYGQTSPQMDLIFYNQGVDFALNSDLTSILPAEALLASIEVKSMLNQAEILKSINAAQKLRMLMPFGKPLGGTNVGSATTSQARYYHCVFAYNTDLTPDNWLEKEAKRFLDSCKKEHLIDAVYVVGRGLLNISHGMGRLEDESGGAITSFYFSILNFIQREARRRGETPYERYVTPATNAWVKLR
jgi:hypothetical protein